MTEIYEIDTKNLGFNTPEEKILEEALNEIGKRRCIRSRGEGLTYVIETTMRLPQIEKEKIRKMNDVEDIRKTSKY